VKSQKEKERHNNEYREVIICLNFVIFVSDVIILHFNIQERMGVLGCGLKLNLSDKI